MSKEKIFTDVLTKKYRHEDFLHFAAEFFTGMNFTAQNLPQSPPASFAEHVKEYFVIGTYSADAEQILILAVNLNENKSVEYSRSAQRNFVKAIMGDNDAVIAAFYSDAAPEKWRLSFVQIDSTFTPKGIETTITPANRSSFLVGENEPVNTARAQLFPLFADDENLPTKDELTEAFGVERVTQKFFDEYRNKYFELRELLNKNPDFQAAKKNFNAEQFAKKLLGQIVFLYFLQKKGWLGVDKNSPWGSGHVKFVQKIFDDCARDGKNFFREVLEPLFYTALNSERPDDFYTPLGTRIPFLNGGLFEPLDEHWRDHDFKLGNEIFSDGENGILDIFNRYNFTICEDAPKEHEVAVDPEMLGKIFENLLESGDRKVKGAFYTPREIVSRMCREALTDYLVERTKIPAEAVTEFLLHGEEFRDDDAENLRTGRPLKLNAEIFNRRAEIDNLLKNVKVADPAVGSGAFPLGMLIEIVTARDVLTTYLRGDENFSEQDRRPYALKCDTIKNCIFACDIDPSAVDIAKLRLWLSIVIDDAPRPDEKNFKPHRLPNLDCNIICGNSLIDAFEGVPLLTTSKFFGNLADGKQGTLDQVKFDIDVANLIGWQQRLFNESNLERKKNLREQIRKFYDEIVIAQLHDKDLTKKYREAAKESSLPFVLWQLYFPTVFKGGGGFDIVIGNPPYGAKLSDADKKFCKKVYRCAKTVSGVQKGSTDTFALFIERAFDLCTTGGVVSLIVSMSFTSSDSMTALHNLLEQNCRKLQIASFAHRPKQIFSAVAFSTSIVSFVKTLTPVEKIFTSKTMRRNENHTLKKIMEDLTFIDSSELKLPGRYPKIGNEIQRGILSKIFHAPKHLADFADDDGEFFYYRSAGGRYYKVVTLYPTGSSAESVYRVKAPFAKIFGATLSTNLFWFYQQVYMNGLDIKRTDLDLFPTFDAEKLSAAQLERIEKLYDEYLADIERNAAQLKSSGNSSYLVSTFKVYKLGLSKNFIDALDDCIDELYGLTADEISYLKNFELEFRLGD